MKQQSFAATLERDKDGTWCYVRVPKHIRKSFKEIEHRGIVHVTATVGKTHWPASMLPWEDGSAQITITKAIRLKEALELGKELLVTVIPRG